jgi:hypothetical protein
MSSRISLSIDRPLAMFDSQHNRQYRRFAKMEELFAKYVMICCAHDLLAPATA